MSSRLLASLKKVNTTANLHSFMLFGRRTIIISIIILSSIFIAALPLPIILPNQSAFATPPGESSSRIAFTSTRDLNEEIYVMNAEDGSEQIRLTNNNDIDQFPNWSPNSTKIAFTSTRDLNEEIYVMNAADGSNQIRLTNNNTSDTHPSWSPDGTKIAFTSTRDGNFEIYVMNAADGSEQIRLTNNNVIDRFPDWNTAATEPK
jgi:Tol biopolymer transport system component